MTEATVSFDPGVHGKLPRIACLGVVLAAGETHVLDEGQAHHLRVVLRLVQGEAVRVFNSADGEWLAQLHHEGKRGARVVVAHRLRTPVSLPDVWLVASVLKKDALEMMVEKASELGTARFVPVIAERTAVHRMNNDRAHAQAVDAAEQCERFDVMTIDEVQPLERVLAQWPQERMLYVALERSAAPPFLAALRTQPPGEKLAVLVGPEGGFSPGERARLLDLPFVQAVSLGPTVLRAESAAVAALALLTGFIQANG